MIKYYIQVFNIIKSSFHVCEQLIKSLKNIITTAVKISRKHITNWPFRSFLDSPSVKVQSVHDFSSVFWENVCCVTVSRRLSRSVSLYTWHPKLFSQRRKSEELCASREKLNQARSIGHRLVWKTRGKRTDALHIGTTYLSKLFLLMLIDVSSSTGETRQG